MKIIIIIIIIIIIDINCTTKLDNETSQSFRQPEKSVITYTHCVLADCERLEVSTTSKDTVGKKLSMLEANYLKGYLKYNMRLGHKTCMKIYVL
jgi:hypothetical protein